MKKSCILLLLLLCKVFLNAQNYSEEMYKTIQSMNQAQNLEAFLKTANRFERIGLFNDKEWLPNYYTSYLYAKMSYLIKEDKERDKYLDRAEDEYSKAKKKENTDKPEMMILSAYIMQARFSVSYMSRLSMNKKSLEILKDVTKKYPSNPRGLLLLGVSYYNMPGFIGGDKKKACELFVKAKEAFISFELATKNHPNWGEELNNVWLKKCK
ncbi:hypothetical protein LJC54_02340 [Parabacteroides sp. OttesenSCG-928-J18]|nr:hypothetical protein [Bacteroides sp. OttesenSCG-928-N06]MDL2244327.1 hypothetical protein [Parabacteroides sp. OttesenSCG-928-J18]MDL2255227.1 hypothetical protein [Parabacteroides sp. OttesenSCG-928-K15]MDL2305289.1 hypothetical protein [Bacteroides sp. OttesenSCG-928-D19]